MSLFFHVIPRNYAFYDVFDVFDIFNDLTQFYLFIYFTKKMHKIKNLCIQIMTIDQS